MFRIYIALFFCLSMMSFSNSVYSQITARIEFSGNQKQVKETKKILGKYDIYFVLSDDEEIKGTYTKDSLFLIENITDEQKEQIKKQEFILVKFKNKKFCYYSLLPNGYFSYKTIRSLMIYESTKKHKFIGKRRKRYALNFSFTSKGMSLSIPLSLIPCSEYQGEFDNGLESYRKHREREY